MAPPLLDLLLTRGVPQVAYNFSLPYETSVQKDGLTYPVHVWKDAEAGLMRTDTYGGVNQMYILKVRIARLLLRS